jgi:predicted extracellular nuclease
MRLLRVRTLAAALAVFGVMLATAAPGRAAVPLSVVAKASPTGVPPGGQTLLTATVTPADTPPSTGILVTVNVGSIGGPPSLLLHDDGTNGDVTPGDNVFSALVTIGAATPSGLKMLAVTVSDAQARTATTKITLTVAGGPTLVISQVYGGGGNTGAPYANDYIEIFNRGPSTVSLSGLSLQYASATGTGNFGANAAQLTELSGDVAPGQYWLVEEAGGATGSPLPPADVVDSTPINMGASAGKVALVTGTTSLGCNGGSAPCSASAITRILDLVGYDGANFYEGPAPAPTLSNTTAALRVNGGCTDTDDNSADFVAGSPTPRNSLSLFNFCGDQPPFVTSRSPSNGATDVSVDAAIGVGFSEAVDVTGSWFSISCSLSGTHTADASGGPIGFTLDPDADFAPNESCTVTIDAADVSDQDTDDPPDTMTADDSWSFTTTAPPLAIHAIQGASHISPYLGQTVTTSGIVTALGANGFWMQDPSPDASVATSEGIFVFTSSPPNSVAVGDAVRIGGQVREFRPGGAGSTNLTTTELGLPTITVLSHGNPLPLPTVVGTGGRIPPGEVIEDDAAGDVETSGSFDAESDGIDFWESMEGMLLQLDDAVAVGPTSAFGETPVVGDDGANASVRTARGGLVIRPTDFNPERILVDDQIVPGLPALNVGDHYAGTLNGVLDYSFGTFKLELTSVPAVVHDGVSPESTTPAGLGQVAVGTFNVENLDPTDPPEKFARLAGILVNNLKSPDIVSVEEVQDNTGPADDGVVDADVTLDLLVSAIQSAGGPAYAYRQINPVNDADGGEPGGNIRQAILFRTDRGLSFVDRPGGGPTTATTVASGPNGAELSASPGRIDPTNSAFSTSRKPLAGEFLFHGHHLFVIANHFNSKGGDEPPMGRHQPPTRSSEVQRHSQAQVVHDFVQSILSVDPTAGVVVDGDLNDFEFSDAVSALKTGVLHDLIETLPQNERYSYVFEGNSQTLDHVLLSDALFARPFVYDVVHVNSEFADQASDHDPSVARITLNDAPTAGAGGPYTVAEGSSVGLSATGSDPEGGALTFAWDLDGDGSFETAGQSVTFMALDGPASATVSVRVTDDGGLSDVAETTVDITNVAPTVTALTAVPTQTFTGENVTFTGAATDPSSPDTAAGFTWAFDTGSGFGAFGGNPFVTSFASCGTYNVAAKAQDKDGGVSEPFTAAPVQVYGGSILPPLSADEVNLVHAGQVVPVKITVGCSGFLSGLHPLISVRAGDYDPNVDPGDPSSDVGENAGSADTNGVMREVGEQYLYNLVVPAAPAGSFFTVLIRPFGGSSPTLHALLRIRR